MSIAYDDSTSNIAQPPYCWYRILAGLGELPDSARERTVADFLVDRADRDGLNPRTLVVPFCRHRGFTDRPDFKVGSVMREVVISQRRAVLGPPLNGPTRGSGFPTALRNAHAESFLLLPIPCFGG